MKKVILSFLLGAMIFGTAGVHAAGGNMIEVFYNIKDIKINKVSSMPDEKPFTYKGTTYVPLRYISEELGMNVKWESSKQTVHIGETEESNAVYPGNGLDHMNYQEGSSWHSYEYQYNSNKKIKDNIGNEYSNYLILGVDQSSEEREWNYIEFPLNGQYKQFVTTVGLTDKRKSITGKGTLEIFLDDKLVKEISLKAGQMPENVTINTTNANKITFRLAITEKSNMIEFGLFDARFLK